MRSVLQCPSRDRSTEGHGLIVAFAPNQKRGLFRFGASLLIKLAHADLPHMRSVSSSDTPILHAHSDNGSSKRLPSLHQLPDSRTRQLGLIVGTSEPGHVEGNALAVRGAFEDLINAHRATFGMNSADIFV